MDEQKGISSVLFQKYKITTDNYKALDHLYKIGIRITWGIPPYYGYNDKKSEIVVELGFANDHERGMALFENIVETAGYAFQRTCGLSRAFSFPDTNTYYAFIQLVADVLLMGCIVFRKEHGLKMDY